ncbi:hypothetical protein BGW38_001613, partial [Lunasporangiospora selenospora]
MTPVSQLDAPTGNANVASLSNGNLHLGNGTHSPYLDGVQEGNGSSPQTLLSLANSHLSHLTLYTGNIMKTGTTASQLNSSTSKKSNQELVSAIQDTLLFSMNTAQIRDGEITITDETSVGPLEGERASYEITVKMFYLAQRSQSLSGSGAVPAGVSDTGSGSVNATTGTGALSAQQLRVALADLESVLALPGIKIDHFILSLPNQVFDENPLDEIEAKAFEQEFRSMALPVWRELSIWRRQGKIGRLGVAEFSKDQLVILKRIVQDEEEKIGQETVLVEPEVDQVNLTDCCVLPKDLVNYAKQENIELLIHGDAM